VRFLPKTPCLLTVAGFICPFMLYAADKPTTVEELSDAIKKLEQKVDMTAEMIEQAGATDTAVNKTHLVGYGEVHYNSLDSSNEIDFHRFVLYVSHEYSDHISMHSELELEHSIAGENQNGEIELEQAYIDIDLGGKHTVRTGLFLIPIGIMNETHEPPTFYGVERNPVEHDIIPATWWEGGISVYGEITPGWGYDIAVTSGLQSGDYTPRS